MFDPLVLLAVSAAFVLAGFVKGVIGLGLPTISIGLLALLMPPVQAAAILVVPSILTNLWQMLVGPGFLRLLARIWPMLAGVVVGTIAGSGLMTGAHAWVGTLLLGLALLAYAALGLSGRRFVLDRSREPIVGPIVGLATGLVTAATGVFVIPAVPYLQAIGLEKNELVQALGISFMVATLALGLNVATAGAFHMGLLVPILAATAAAFAGMGLGQVARAKLDPVRFRRWFFLGLAGIGTTLVIRAVV